MTQVSRAAFAASLAAKINDNTAQEVTPQDEREMFEDLSESVIWHDEGGAGVSDGDKGDITVSGSGAAWAINSGAVTLTNMADLATARLLGRATAGMGVPEALTAAQATALLDAFTSSLKGLVPASGGGTSNFLRADGAWAAPGGGGASQVVHLQETTASGVSAGTATSGSWFTRAMNTVILAQPGNCGLVRELAYDAQSGNFTVGQTVTGGTSGATGYIVADVDAGATGTLKLVQVVGTFADNETITDPMTGSALANIPSGVVVPGTIWLSAGTWDINASSWGHKVAYHKVRLWNVTASASLGDGLNAYANTTGNGMSRAHFVRRVVLASASELRLEHQVGSTAVTSGRGGADGFGGLERHSEIFARSA